MEINTETPRERLIAIMSAQKEERLKREKAIAETK